MIEQLGWPLLVDRRATARLSEFYKIINGTSPISSSELTLHVRSSRSSTNNLTYINMYSRTNIRKYSFFPRTSLEWNSLPLEVKSSSSVESFKAKLANHLTSSTTLSLSSYN